MPNYLPGMLEVPMVDGQSECICGRDDRFYHFGLWTDYCGISMKELKKYNSFCGEYCEGGGHGSGCTPCPCPDCPPCPEPPEPPVQDPQFRFTFVPHNASNQSLLTTEFVDTMIEAYFYTRDYIEMEYSLGQPVDSYSPYEFRIYAERVPVPGLNNMSDADARAATIANSVDIVFAVDSTIDSWVILDSLGLPFETEGYRFDQIGTVPYGDITFRILRYRNPLNLSTVYDPATGTFVRTFVIKFIKN